MRPAVLTVALRAFPGAEGALAHLARTTGLTRHVALASPRPDGAEVGFLAAHVRERRPALVLFGGWSPAYAALLAAAGRRGPAAWGVYWTSTAGQGDLGRETAKLADVLGDARIAHVLCASAPLARALAPHRAGVAHLPPTLAWPDLPAVPRPRPGPPAVTLFGPAPEYPRKNVTSCLLALAGLPRRACRLVLNGLSGDPHYRRLLDALGLSWEDRGWMARADYEAEVAGAAVGLQPSFTESYDYVAAEHLARGVPVVASPAVPVVARLPAALRERLVVSSPEDVAGLRRRVARLLERPRARRALGRAARAAFRRHNAADVRTARAVLDRLVAGPRRP